uniref:peptidylprolyl isomerase n=1 Tax=Globisporangium ultimum (strain ATCC 200006 / CBS 805.95 / DAOM BR144) TaxID=431595 RepID=K3W5S2_GLOUD
MPGAEKHAREEEEEHDAKRAAPPSDDEDDDGGPMPMPMFAAKKAKKHKSLPFESVFVSNLPSAAMYEKSYMHRDVVTHVAVALETQFLITASRDGHVKFWKKMAKGIEFVKHYKAHLGEILGLAVSRDGLRLSTTSTDQHIKFYDVLGFDMVNMLKVAFTPSECCWIYAKTGASVAKIVVADQNEPLLRIYNAEDTRPEPLYMIEKVHTAPVTVLGFNAAMNCVISGDLRGHLEYWSAETYKFPTSSALTPGAASVKFKFKGETDLYELAKCKTYATSIDVSASGQDFVVTAKDAQIRVFRFATGKLRRKYDETLTVFEDAQADGTLHLDAIDFGRRAAVEREFMNSVSRGVVSNCVFDESGHFILYPTLLGIKIVNIETNKLVKVLGKVENSDRFLRMTLFQGKPKVNSQLEKHLKNSASGRKQDAAMVMSDDTERNETIDPTLFVTSFKKNRFFLFTAREPEDDDDDAGPHGSGRDVFNEKPTTEEAQVVSETASSKVLGETAILHTTMGDITIKLFGKECPKSVENFCTHARNGYYDNVLFHRVIKNFMVQTGDPLGDGTGGESIWGGEFEDEFHRSLRHDRPFTVSMANAGPGTNGSQFFITTVPTPWLDNKHTVFGRVEHGKDTVSAIEHARVDKYDKPVKDIQIINVDIF